VRKPCELVLRQAALAHQVAHRRAEVIHPRAPIAWRTRSRRCPLPTRRQQFNMFRLRPVTGTLSGTRQHPTDRENAMNQAAPRAADANDPRGLSDPALISSWALARAKVTLNPSDSEARKAYADLRAEYLRRTYGSKS
jgi:hypothetical protein